MRNLKHDTKGWIKDKLVCMDSASSSFDQAIESILFGPSNGILTREELAQLTLLRAERQKILDHDQLTWQLKSRTKRALQGDSNTKIFIQWPQGGETKTRSGLWKILKVIVLKMRML